jgi:CBS domain-containing protein
VGTYLGRIGEHVGHQSVLDLMSETVVSIGPESPLFEAGSRMLREHVHRMPVVDAEDHLFGIVSMTDILSAFVECAPAKAD